MSSLSTEAETRIFDAALAAFAARGREGARMQEIADAAQVNKAMLHYYFRSKDALYAHVFGVVIGQFARSFEKSLTTSGSFADTLHAFIDTYLDFLATHPDVPRLMMSEMLAGAPVARARMAELRERGTFIDTLFLQRVDEAVGRGEIRPVAGEHLLLTLLAACIFPFLARPLVEIVVPQAAQDPAAFRAARKAEIFRLIHDGLRPGGGTDAP